MRRAIHLPVSALIFSLAFAGCSTGPYQPSVQAQQQRKSAMEHSDYLVVPGERIGPIHLGMGMDEVEALLGQEHDGGTLAEAGIGETWNYISLNLEIGFDASSAPSVNFIATTTWTKNSTTFGEEKFSEDYPVSTVFHLDNGIALGSTSFEVKRAFGSNFEDVGNSGIMMAYDNAGISFRVTKQEHRVVAIMVRRPR